MLSNEARTLFEKLQLPYPAVAIKFSFVKPADTKKSEETLSFCQFLKLAQDSGEKFCISADNDNCFGKNVLGMEPRPPFEASGQAGYDFGVFRTPAANARLHNTYPTLVAKSVNYVTFCPVSSCDFDPDLVICVAALNQADILMRATSYISGDLWESKSSCVMSCAWTYVYPYLSGKVNFCITGMHHGLKRRKIYPPGLHIISIPYQKLLEVTSALGEMDWELIAMREDEDSRRLLKQKMDAWKEMAPAAVIQK